MLWTRRKRRTVWVPCINHVIRINYSGWVVGALFFHNISIYPLQSYYFQSFTPGKLPIYFCLLMQFIFIPIGPNTGPGPTARNIHFRARDYKGTESKYGLWKQNCLENVQESIMGSRLMECRITLKEYDMDRPPVREMLAPLARAYSARAGCVILSRFDPLIWLWKPKY